MMASAIASLVSHLKGDFAVAQRVGSRIYRQIAGQAAVLPYIVVERTGTDHRHHQTAAAGLVATVFELTCWADGAEAAEGLAEDVREALDGLHHQDIGTQPNVITVRSAVLETDDDNLVSADAVGNPIFGVPMTWQLWHTESVPTFA